MGKLNELFQQYDNMRRVYNKLVQDILIYEVENKHNEILNKYVTMLKQKEEFEKTMKTYEGNLYSSMLEEGIDLLEGTEVDVTLKKPYYKTEFNFKAFKEDYKPTSSLYQKYVKEKLVKGNVILKEHKS